MSNELFENCITVINELFSINESINFLEALYRVEEKAVKHEYKNFESFSVDIIPLLKQQKTLKSYIQHPNPKIPEDYCNKAIYNYYQFDSNSTLYTLNLLLHSLYEPLLHFKIDSPVLPRLYIKHNRLLLNEIKQNTSGTLALFSNISKKRLNDNNNYAITGNVMIVHPLGDYYSMDDTCIFDGWMKVKVVRSARFKSVLPGYFLDELMDQPGTLKKVVLPKASDDLQTARNNEMIRRFISNITASCTDNIQLYPPPIQYVDSLIPLSDSLSTPDSEHQSTSKSSVEVSWRKLKQFCHEKFAKVVNISDYTDHIHQQFHARGHFKRIFFIENNQKTLQLFYKCTTSQKVTELASYLALKNTACIGNMTEMIVDKDGQALGLVMNKYDMTLHSYAKRGLTSERKYELILQMWKSLVTIHRRGIAHRDLSAHNFMIKQTDESVNLYLIDFGKAVFFRSKDAQHWWVDSNESHVYQDELRPMDEEELSIWCKNLPYMMSKPDHGHRLFRSIQTLPKNSDDHITLPYLINPVAEDVYSLGVMTWNLFSDKLPWPGVFDSDLKQIRNTVISPAEIDRLIRREVPGPLSKYLLSVCLRVNPLQRQTADQILEWLDRPSNKQNIISEWNLYYSNTSRRHR